MKRILSYALSFMMVLSLLVFPNMEANASNVSLGVSASTINIGDTVTVSVTVPEGITASVDLSFSSNVLSFVSASADVGANGSTITMNVGKYSLAASNTVSVTFKANTSGTASMSASVTSAVDNNTAEETSLGGASTSITVANQASTPPAGGGDTTSETKSADNSLAALKLSSGTLSPSFAYNVTNYTATVGYNVSSVVVSATPSNAKATIESVTGNGNVNLQVGENTIKVVVKAENGVQATYTVVVTRLAEGESTDSESESESETQDTPVTEDVLQWNGQKLEPAEEVPAEIIPADFNSTTIMVNSVETPCLTFANGDLKVLYLKNEEGTTGLYVYDEVQQVVYPFVKIETENSYVMVLLPDEANAPAPENYKACTLSIEGKGMINAYQFVQPASTEETGTTETTGWFAPETFYAAEPVASDFYLIYCMSNTGERGWYVYDSVEGTFQRYLGSVHAPTVESETVPGGAAGSAEEYNKLLNELESAKKMQLMVICAAAFIIIVLVVIIINLVLKRRSDEEFDEDFDDDDYEDDDEYYDEYEFEEDEDTTKEVAETTTVEEEVAEDDEIEIEFYEMPQEENIVASVEETEDDDEIEIEFYEMTDESEVKVEEKVTEEDEVEVEFYDMEELLMKEAIAPEETSKREKEIPAKKSPVAPAPVSVENIYMDDDDDDDDLEFIELD